MFFSASWGFSAKGSMPGRRSGEMRSIDKHVLS